MCMLIMSCITQRNTIHIGIAISITTFGRAIEALDEPLILIEVLDVAIKADFASKTAQTSTPRQPESRYSYRVGGGWQKKQSFVARL